MHSFPANKTDVSTAKVEALVVQHSKALTDAAADVKAIVAKVEALEAQLARHEAQLARSVLRKVWAWLTHYEGLV